MKEIPILPDNAAFNRSDQNPSAPPSQSRYADRVIYRFLPPHSDEEEVFTLARFHAAPFFGRSRRVKAFLADKYGEEFDAIRQDYSKEERCFYLYFFNIEGTRWIIDSKPSSPTIQGLSI